ncbi:MAG: hypothetical protein NW701_12645 [Nitrospira sp.]
MGIMSSLVFARPPQNVQIFFMGTVEKFLVPPVAPWMERMRDEVAAMAGVQREQRRKVCVAAALQRCVAAL